jgi:ABC-type glycerol-3-phosphate transport system permease component
VVITSKKAGRGISQIILHLILVLLMVCMLYPLLISIFIALKNQDAFRFHPWTPTIPLWFSNFKTAYTVVGTYIYNTIFVGLTGVTGMLFLSSISAYVFSRMNFPGREIIYYAVISLMMVPGVLTLVPTYMLYSQMNMLNTYAVLIVPIIFGGSVGGVFLLRAFFGGIPESTFEAARMDGCTEFQSYLYVCLPLSKAILGTLAIQQIIAIWNDIVWPTITISNPKLWTISAGLFRQFSGQYANNTPVQFAGYILASMPLILLFTFANKYYIEGLTSAGLKL